jgi:eukaryotic-like serine/threonine-protein kinase
MPQSPGTSIVPGTRLGPYEIQNVIGVGGMGEVFRARDPRLGRDVAIKILPEAFATDSDRRARFDREAQTVASLSHPNVVSVFDTGVENGRLYLVMELLSGESLREHLKQGALAPRKAIDIAVQIARGLAAAHDKGLVHRDLKPENIFLQPDGHVKILDFGLARGFTPDASGATQTAAITDPGLVMGTVGYMAPEQVRGQAVDARTDLFALGAVLYETLAGQRAFQRDTAADTMTAILKEDPPELAAVRPDVSPALDRIVRHAVEKNPVERFQTARDVAFALGALSASGTAAQPTVDGTRRSWMKIAGAVLAAAVLLGAGAIAGGALAPAAEITDFAQRTFDSNIVVTGRFMPDGKTIVYTARMSDGTFRLFELRTTSVAPKMLGAPNTTLLAVSRSGEFALLTQARVVGSVRSIGMLSRMTFGEEPRPIVNDITEADWSPDGSSLAIVRRVAGLDQLEYPIGTILYKSAGYVSDIRISPDGKRVLFMDHESANDDRGWVRIADGTTITTVAGEFSTENGTAWTPDGTRVLFSGGQDDQINRVWIADAPAPGGPPPSRRLAVGTPGAMVVLDVAADGTLLTASDNRRYHVGAKVRTSTTEQDLSWLDMSWSPSLSADGSLLLFSDGHGGAGYSAVVRRIGESISSISRLGPGGTIGLSPDGKYALAVDLGAVPQKLIAYSIGPGNPVTLPSGNITKYELDEPMPWFPDHRTFAFQAAEPNKRTRMYKQSVDGGEPVPFLGENVRIALVSRDGQSAIGIDSDQKWRRYAVSDGRATDLPGLTATDRPAGWTDDDRALIVGTFTIPARLERVDLLTGARKLLREVRAPDLDSRIVTIRTASADGEQFAYSGVRRERTLFTVTGVAGIK